MNTPSLSTSPLHLLFNISTLLFFTLQHAPIHMHILPIITSYSTLNSPHPTHTPLQNTNMGKPLHISFFLSFFFTFVFFILHPSSATNVYNVISFGAKGDGLTDSTKAFTDAWAAACASIASTTSIIFVPRGRYLLRPAVFAGQCTRTRIIILIKGTLVAPSDYRILGKADSWFSFEGVSGVSILGGVLDARGHALWACKAAGNQQHCPSGATVRPKSIP